MSTLKEQFEKRDENKPKPKWVYGDRVSGKIGKVLIVGMVIREDYNEPDMVLVHSDLPVKSEDGRVIIRVPSRGMKKLKEM